MVKLMWVTPEADKMIGYLARVSNPKATPEDPADKLIVYLLRNQHWSPFEMANMCVEINTSRDIARQILRHRSFSFQEFSQRYAEVTEWCPPREARLQDTKNRQNSLPTSNLELQKWWEQAQERIMEITGSLYQEALSFGLAKEVARSVLPEGLTPTKMYMNGSVRSWLTYFSTRIGHGTQKEHQDVALQLYGIFKENLPDTAKAWELTR